MFSKPLLIYIGMDTPYLIYRMTYAEAQTYHETITSGFVVKNNDEKFKLVLVINDNRQDLGYIYGNTDDPAYDSSTLTYNFTWYELRAYCKDSIMNVGQSTLTFCSGASHNINFENTLYESNPEYYSLGRRDYGSYNNITYDYIARNIVNSYSDSIRYNNDMMRTVDISYDHGLDNMLTASGFSWDIINDQVTTSYNRWWDGTASLSRPTAELYINNVSVGNIPIGSTVAIGHQYLQPGLNTAQIGYSAGSDYVKTKTFNYTES